MIESQSEPSRAVAREPSTLVVAAAPEAIKSARDFARGWLVAAGYGEDAVYIGLLVVSELVTNAYRHGSRPGEAISVRLSMSAAGPVAEVRDASSAEPRALPFRLDTFSGRGLAMVSEITAEWGFRLLATGGKTVYAVMREGTA